MQLSRLIRNPFTGEIVVNASHRMNRPYRPTEGCPFCPSTSERHNPEIPSDDYDVVVFDNKFPPLSQSEVIVYCKDHTPMSKQPVQVMENVLTVLADRTCKNAMSSRYVHIFENRGEACGVTLHHPHCQVYALPFVPPVIERELAGAHEFYQENGRRLVDWLVETEGNLGLRVVENGDFFLALVPEFARFPFEVHIYPKQQLPYLWRINDEERRELARIMRNLIRRYDSFWGGEMPYVMTIHQAPNWGEAKEWYDMHVEFYPMALKRGKLKYMAGSEIGAGVAINDLLPTDAATVLWAQDF
jgi:UDPglucose--hexose-1-phosphate uridylyltransferase